MMRVARLAVLSWVSFNSGVAFACHEIGPGWLLLAGAALLTCAIASAEEHGADE